MKRLSSTLILVLVSVMASSGQTQTPTQRQTVPQINESRLAADMEQLRRLSENIPPSRRATFGMTSSRRAEIIEHLEDYHLQGERFRILPDQKYFKQFAEFLDDGDTGLARIFPDMKCDEGKTVSVTELERCADVPTLRGGASFYSFRNRTNINQRGEWADIHFIDGKFVVGSATAFGLIGEIGDQRLDELTLKSKELIFLKEYDRKNRASEIKEENTVFEKGVTENGFKYSLSAPYKLNSVYVLRSIAYVLKTHDILDQRVDIIVAFKVVARENGGSVIVLWKKLKQKYAPVLKEK